MVKTKFTDKEIINGIRKRDNDVFRFVYIEYFSFARSLVFKTHGKENDAEDVFQEAFISLINYLDKKKNFELKNNKGKPVKFSTFFYRFCQIWNYKRINGIKTTNTDIKYFENLLSVDDIQKEIERQENVKLLGDSIIKLKEDCQEIIHLRDFKEMNYKDIGERLDIKENTANQRYLRCFEILKKLVIKL